MRSNAGEYIPGSGEHTFDFINIGCHADLSPVFLLTWSTDDIAKSFLPYLLTLLMTCLAGKIIHTTTLIKLYAFDLRRFLYVLLE